MKIKRLNARYVYKMIDGDNQECFVTIDKMKDSNDRYMVRVMCCDLDEGYYTETFLVCGNFANDRELAEKVVKVHTNKNLYCLCEVE